MPLISIVIALPNPCVELMYLYHAGILSIEGVGFDSEVIPKKKEGLSKFYGRQ
jgi:hypothetical protein